MSEAACVRTLERRDLPELVELCKEHAAYERAEWVERERLGDLEALLLDSSDTRCWVAEIDGQLAGFASASLELSTWDAAHYLHLDCLYLRGPFRGRGLGRALFQRVAAAVGELGAVNLQWQTPQWNQDAERFYRRLGAQGKEKVRFTLGPEECRALLSEGRAAPSANGEIG